MIYRVLKPFVINATRNYFREIRIRGEAVEEGPLLIVSNHPNVMLDGLLAVISFKRRFYFLVKAEAFKWACVNWFLRALYLIPVARRADSPDGTVDNRLAFSKAIDVLHKQEAILVFPEGYSVAQHSLNTFKTGAARIALQAEAAQEFKLGLKIQAVGITYSDFFRFNSTVTVRLGKPVTIERYQQRYEKDPAQAVRDLTDEIKSQISAQIVEFPDYEQAGILEKLDKLYHSRGTALDDRSRLQMVGEKLDRLLPKFKAELEQFERRLNLYLNFARSLRLDGSRELDNRERRLFLLGITPFVIFGLVTLYVPYRLSTIATRYLAIRRSQISSVALSTAFVLFPLWCLLCGLAVWFYTNSLGWGVGFIAMMIASGYFTSRYFNHFALFVFQVIWPARKTPVEILREMRDELILEIDEMLAKV